MRLNHAFLLLCTSTQAVPLFTTPVHGIQKRELSYSPVDSSATCGAKALLAKLQSTYGTSYLSGQQDRQSLQWVQSNIGETPAIQGNDFMEYSPSRVEHGSSGHSVEDAQAFAVEGGINAFVWHWNAPTGLYDTTDEPWYSGFYTAATSFNVADALAEGIDGSNYKLLLRDIDAIANEIKRLSDSDIAILWRPLHEPDGGWFWWGAHGAEAFKQLWDLMYDRLTDYHDLHNMIWVCNTMDTDWYPGNEKCDVVTTDIYANIGDHSSDSSSFSMLESLSGGERVVALAEVGEIPDPKQLTSEHVPWAYWMTWSGDYINGDSYNTKDFLIQVYNNENVITIDGSNKLGGFGCGSTLNSGGNGSSISVESGVSTLPSVAAVTESFTSASSTFYGSISTAVESSESTVGLAKLNPHSSSHNFTRPAGPSTTDLSSGTCVDVITVTIHSSTASLGTSNRALHSSTAIATVSDATATSRGSKFASTTGAAPTYTAPSYNRHSRHHHRLQHSPR